MKNLLTIVAAAALAMPLVAQEAAPAETAQREAPRGSSVWPAFCAICEYPASPDVIGLRVTIPFSTRQENVTGIDVGLWGRSIYFEGIQLNVLRNDVSDSASGIQVGLYNSIGRGDMMGIQAGLWNEAGCLRGVQGGLVNVAGDVEGFQIGIVNRTETMYGFQVGLVNIIREAELQFCPVVNIGF